MLAPAPPSISGITVTAVDIWRKPPSVPASSAAPKPLAELHVRLRLVEPLEEGSSAPGETPRGTQRETARGAGRGGPQTSARGLHRAKNARSRHKPKQAKRRKRPFVSLFTIELELELELESWQDLPPTPKPRRGAAPARRPVFTNALSTLAAWEEPRPDPLAGAAAYRPALLGEALQRGGRWKDQRQAIKAGWRLKAARLLLDPRHSHLVTLNLADEEVEANARRHRHLAFLAGTLRKGLMRDLGSPSFVSALELHKSRTASRHPVNPRFGAHVHLILQLPEELIPIFKRRLFRYVERAHACTLRRHGLPPPRIRQERRRDGSIRLRLDLPGRTVGESHLGTNVGLAAHITRIDPDRRFHGSGRHGLEGALDYTAKKLHRLNPRLRDLGLRCGEGEGGRAVRGEALHVSNDIDDLAKRLFGDPDAHP